jgi:hypothetical protein
MLIGRAQVAATLWALLALAAAAGAAGAISGGGALGEWGSRQLPRTPQITAGPANPTTETTATFRFASKGRVSGYECRLDRAPFTPCTSPKTYSDLSVGVHAFEVVAVVGDARSPAALWVWSIEPRPAAPPATPVIVSGPASVTTSQDATFSFSSPTPGVSYLCRLDGGSFAPCTSPKTYGGLALGSHRFEVKARDASGLESGVATFTWQIEAAPPPPPPAPPATPTIHSGPASVTNTTSATFEFSSTTSGVSYRCRLDAASFASCTSPRTYASLGAGSHRFEVMAVSSSGLESGVAAYTWTIDTTRPTVTITAPTAGATLSGTATIAVSASDNLRVERVELRIDGSLRGTSTVAPHTFTWDTTKEANGQHTVEVRAFDVAGNQSAPAASTYSVSNSASTSSSGWSCNGVHVAPGLDSVAAAVAANPAGTFCIRAGVHRFTTAVVPKAGSTFIGEPGAIWSGARDITASFVPSGSFWVASGMTMEGYGDPGWPTSPCGSSGGTLCLRTNNVFYDDRWLTRVGSLSELSSGEFFFDYANDRIYIADNPAGHRVEVAVAPQAVRSFRTDAVNVTISGIVVEKFATPANSYAIEGKDGWVLDRVEIRLNHACGATAQVLRNSLVHDNGQCGFSAADGSGLTVENNVFYENHRTSIAPWHTAAVKVLRSRNAVIRNNYVHDEDHMGLWTDWDNVGTLYEGNRAERIGGPGIFHEASCAAVIRNNTVRNAGFAPEFNGWIDGSGILVNSSRDVQIYGNRVEDTKHGIGATSTSRGSGPNCGEFVVRNFRVHDNVVRVGGGGRAAGGVAGTVTQPFTSQAFYDRNSYTLCASTLFAGPKPAGSTTQGYLSWSEWRAQGQDPSSTISITC